MAVEVHGTQIRIPQGDTGVVKFMVSKGELNDEDLGVFTLARRDGTPMLRKMLSPDMNDKAFHMRFTYEDTAKVRSDSYEWSFRVVRGGMFDANGKLMDTQGQHTAVLHGRLSILTVAGGVR